MADDQRWYPPELRIGPSTAPRTATPPPNPGTPLQPQRAGGLTKWATVAFFTIGLVAIGLMVAKLVTDADTSGSGPTTEGDSAASVTSEPEGVASAPAATVMPDTTAVIAERKSSDVLLFEQSIDALTPVYNDLVAAGGTGPIDNAEQEAAYLGAWWALGDWCTSNSHGPAGACLDKAAAFLVEYTTRDPRTINSATWGQPGAIAGAIANGYDMTNQYLGIDSTVLIPELMDGDRPGDSVLCEPSCAAVMDGAG